MRRDSRYVISQRKEKKLPKAVINPERRFRGDKSLAEIKHLVKIKMPAGKVLHEIVSSSDDRFYFIDIDYIDIGNGKKNRVSVKFELVCYKTRVGFYIKRDDQYRNYDNSIVAEVHAIASEIISKIESRQSNRKTKQQKMKRHKAKRRQLKMGA